MKSLLKLSRKVNWFLFFLQKPPKEAKQSVKAVKVPQTLLNPSSVLFRDIKRTPQILDDVFIRAHDKQKKVLEDKLPSLAKSVRRNGLYNKPEFVLSAIYALIQVVITKMFAAIDWEISELKNYLTLISDRLERFDMKEQIAAYHQFFELQKEEERKPFLAQLETLPVKVEELNQFEEQEQNSANLKEDLLRDKYNGNQPDRQFYHNSSVYMALIFGIFIVEIPINFMAVQSLGEMVNALIIPITLVLSGLVAYGSHAIGEAIAENRKDRLKFIGATVLSLCFVILVLRFNGEGAFILTILNFVMVAFGSFFSYIRNFGMAYFNAEKSKEAFGIKVAAKRAEIQKIKDEASKAFKSIDEKFSKRATEKAKVDQKKLEDALLLNRQAIVRLETYKVRRQKEFAGLCDKAISDLRRYTDAERQRKELAPIAWSDLPIPPLNFE